MHSSENQVRVFISSTFRDMHAERDHLVTVVFPELRERLERLGLEFFDVDLRWGVPAKDADGETANSWEYCRQWIDRVEPFFVCMLGQRYGWMPEPGQLKAEEDRQRQQEERRSITDMEIRHAVLTTRLKRRSYFYLRAREAPAAATEYVDPPPLLKKLESLKAEVRTCGGPVWDYPCEWTGSGFSGMEEFGRRVLEDLWSGVLRDERYVGKDVWRQVLGTDPDNDPRYADEAIPVPRELWEKIVTLAKPPPKDPLDAEREQMDAFAASCLRWFQGRTEELETLAGFIGSTGPDDARLAVVAAVPGQGKSALIAKLSTLNLKPSTFQITHFVGATERSASAHALVGRLLAELDRSGIVWPADEQKEGEEPKQDFNSQCLRLAKLLGDYAGERRIVLLLDALNQLSDGHDLNWLPRRLGPSVRVIVSCVDDPAAKEDSPENKVLRSLASRQPAPLRVPLGALTDEDVRVIVVSYLLEYCKELDTPHVETICATPQARNPLYLLVMLGELRTLGGNDMNEVVPKLLASMVTDYPDTVALFRWVLQRLEVFGTEAVQWWCLYLAHGRVGMASHELADLLARKLGADAAATALLLERGLRRYLLRRGGQLDFFHGQLRQAVMDQYGLQAEPIAVHREMADYFTTCAKGADPEKEWETDGVRGFSECVFHLTKAGKHEQATGLLTHFPFLLHKLRVGLLEGVFEDYEMVQVGRDGPSRRSSSDLEIWSTFSREKAHILRRRNDEWPAHKILLQLAVEHADDSPLTLGAERWLADGRCNWIWLRRNRRLPHVQASPCLVVLEGHSYSVNGALVREDGRILSWSEDKTLRLWDGQSGQCLAVLEGHSDTVMGALELAGSRILSWSGDKTLRLWDGQSGQCLAVLEGHSGIVCGALALADGRILSWSRDKTMRLWETGSGDCLATFVGHAAPVIGSLVLADNRLLSWSVDNTLRVWDSESGACLALLDGHTDVVDGALELADGRLLSWSRDKSLRIWDSRSGACMAMLEGHTSAVKGALLLADGRLLSWGDATIRLWDTNSGSCIAIYEGHSEIVRGVRLLANERFLSWSWDKTLRLWDSQRGTCLAILEGHTHLVHDVLVLSSGQVLSWSWESMRLWNTKSSACLVGAFECSPGEVQSALTLPDGRLLSWAGSHDSKLRMWNIQMKAFPTSLEGHTDTINGVRVLDDGRLLTWSKDNTLRLWDTMTGMCLSTLEGHTGGIIGALPLRNTAVLSLSEDKTLRLWDSRNGICLKVTPLLPLARHKADWTLAFTMISDCREVGDCYIARSFCAAQLCHKKLRHVVATWNTDYHASAHHLHRDGTLVVTQSNGQVCILKLHHGHRRITLAEAEAILVERGDLSTISNQPSAL